MSQMGKAAKCIMGIIGMVLMNANQAAPPATVGQPITGRWEGVGIALLLTPTGGKAVLGCASGTISGPLLPDRHGQFRAAGAMETGGPGPQLADVAPVFKEVAYSGRIVAGTMTLELRVTGERAVRRFSLLAGSHHRIVRCL